MKYIYLFSILILLMLSPAYGTQEATFSTQPSSNIRINTSEDSYLLKWTWDIKDAIKSKPGWILQQVYNIPKCDQATVLEYLTKFHIIQIIHITSALYLEWTDTQIRSYELDFFNYIDSSKYSFDSSDTSYFKEDGIYCFYIQFWVKSFVTSAFKDLVTKSIFYAIALTNDPNDGDDRIIPDVINPAKEGFISYPHSIYSLIALTTLMFLKRKETLKSK